MPVFEFLTPTFVIAVLIALSVHEWAHGFVAYKLGDPTAKYDGRLTLNPIAHLDFLGTIMFLVVGFGWGKPVPVNPTYFKHYKRDTALVAVAGPLSNLVLALVAFLILMAMGRDTFLVSPTVMTEPSATMKVVLELLTDFLQINLVLMAFNLLPIAPLDGSKILRPFIPVQYDDQYDQFMARGPQILLILIIMSHFLGFPVFSWWINLVIGPVLLLFTVLASIL